MKFSGWRSGLAHSTLHVCNQELPGTINGDVVEKCNSGEARYETHWGSRPYTAVWQIQTNFEHWFPLHTAISVLDKPTRHRHWEGLGKEEGIRRERFH